jgi:hypothetical protein
MATELVEAEVELQNGKKLPIRFTMNVLCELQEKAGIHPQEITDKAGFVEMRWLLWAGLEGARRKGRGERKKPYTLAEAGDIIDEVGLQQAMTAVGESMKSLGGDVTDGDDEGKPEPAESGTGTTS